MQLLFDSHGVKVVEDGGLFTVFSPCADGSSIPESEYGREDLAMSRAQHLAKWERLNRFFIKHKVELH